MYFIKMRWDSWQKKKKKKSACEYVDLHCARPARYRHFNIVLTTLVEHIFLSFTIQYSAHFSPLFFSTYEYLYIFIFYYIFLYFHNRETNFVCIHEYIINVQIMLSMSRFSTRSFILPFFSSSIFILLPTFLSFSIHCIRVQTINSHFILQTRSPFLIYLLLSVHEYRGEARWVNVYSIAILLTLEIEIENDR